MNVELPTQERKRLTAFVKRHGIGKASERIGCNRGTIANALAGLAVQAGTVSLIRTKLDEEENVRTIRIEDVGAERLRVLLREARVDPSKLSDADVVKRYRSMFGSTCVINSTYEQDKERNG